MKHLRNSTLRGTTGSKVIHTKICVGYIRTVTGTCLMKLGQDKEKWKQLRDLHSSIDE